MSLTLLFFRRMQAPVICNLLSIAIDTERLLHQDVFFERFSCGYTTFNVVDSFFLHNKIFNYHRHDHERLIASGWECHRRRRHHSTGLHRLSEFAKIL